MKKLIIIIVFALAALLAILAIETPKVEASPGQTNACESCHAYPASTLRVTTNIAATTVNTGQAFTVNISWSGGTSGRRTEINWPTNAVNNALFNPTPRIPYSSTAVSGTTTSTLTAPSTPGTYTVRVYAARGSPRDTYYANIAVTVTVANAAPVLSPIGSKSVIAGQPLQFTISATDPNGDPLTYSASNLPTGATFTPSTRTFSWTPTVAGTYSNVTFQISDGLLTDSEIITITVTAANAAPVLNPIGNKSVTVGQQLQFTISATDPNGDPLTYSASNLPSGAIFTPSTRTLSWTPAAAGIYSNVTFQVSDGSLTDSEVITITVNAANAAPLLSPIGNKSAIVGQLLQFTISATDPNNDPLTYSASNLPSGATFTPSTRTFSWTPASAGTYSNVAFQVSDGSLTDSESITITAAIGNAPPVFNPISDKSAIVDRLLQFTISATDPNGDLLTYSASNLPGGSSFNAGTRTFSWTPESEDVGSYPNVRFRVSDSSLTATEYITVTVTANAAPVLNPIGNKSVTVGQQLQFTISATDFNGDSLTYSASNLPSGATFTPVTQTFSWTPASAGTFSNLIFRVSDGSLTDSESSTITVAAPNEAPVLSPIGNKSVITGQLLQFTISATDPNNDPLTYFASNLPSGATFTPSTRTFSWTPTVVGTYSNVTFDVSDGSLSNSEGITITVNAANEAPVLSPISNKSASVGQQLQFTILATDPNNDPLTYSASNLPSGATFTLSTQTFSWTPASTGNFTNVTFQVSDGLLTDSESITITIGATGENDANGANGANGAPVLSPVGNKSAIVGQLLQFTILATDPNSDPLIYSAGNLPPGATFTQSTRTFSWTPTSVGTYLNVIFQVSDGLLADWESITITVGAGNMAPVLSTIGDKSATVGQPLEFKVSAIDPDNDPLNYSVANLPSGANINRVTGTFSWTPTSSQVGTFANIRFQVSDGRLTASENITIMIEQGDIEKPVINGVNVLGTTTREVSISWMTDEPGTSQVEYWGSQRELSPLDENFVTEHTVRLTGLTPGKTYRYKAISKDRAGNLAASTESTFATLRAFTVSDLSITPNEAGIGEQVTISVLVINNTDTDGGYELALRIGDAKDATRVVDLPKGAQERVNFVTTRYAPGIFAVDVNGITDSLSVLAPPPKKGDWSIFSMVAGTTFVLTMSIVGVLLHRRYFLGRM